MKEKPLPKAEFDPIQEVVIRDEKDGKPVRWQVVSTEEGGEFTMHDPGVSNFHQKSLRLTIRRECDGND